MILFRHAKDDRQPRSGRQGVARSGGAQTPVAHDRTCAPGRTWLGYRVREESRNLPSLTTALARTAGLWRQGDGLAWQNRLRDEWDRSE